MLGAIIVLVVATAAVYAGTVWNSTQISLKSTYTQVGDDETLKATKPLTILLMGVDTGDNSRGGSTSWDGNSDSQIVLTLNPKTETATMVSMERDTPTNILDESGNVTGSVQKMNAAYPLGYNNGSSSGGDAGGLSMGAQYAMQTIGQQAGVPIDNFVMVNFAGLINLVNDVGGVEVVNDTGGQDAYSATGLPGYPLGSIYISNTEPEYTAVVPYIDGEPKQLINGDQALVFARDRDTLPNGDYGRAAHQREVITQLAKKILSFDNLSKYQTLLNDVSQDFKTNIEINSSTLQSLLAYKNCFKKIVSIQYQGVGEMWNGVSYQFMPQDVDLAVQNAMLKSLGKPTITTLNSNIITYEDEFGDSAPDYYLPSATVTEGSKTTTYGINTDGSFVTITPDNAANYVSSTGGSVSATTTSSSSTTSSSVATSGQ